MSSYNLPIKKLLRSLRSLLRRSGFDIVRYPPPLAPATQAQILMKLQTLRDMALTDETEATRFLEFCSANYAASSAQLFQDLFALHQLDQKKQGFFVEFGATNGVSISNTVMLEQKFGWRGILAEPARCWHEALRKNRRCSIDFRCVWDRDGQQLEFNEVSDAVFSTINAFTNVDSHSTVRQKGEKYLVESVSLNSLLREHEAPSVIDYLSIDTEGSELQILSAFDFDRYKVRVITVEHNFAGDRERIHSLLTTKGFTQKFSHMSFYDDWYVAPANASAT